MLDPAILPGLIVGTGVLLGVVFVISFRYALRQRMGPDASESLPAATLVGGDVSRRAEAAVPGQPVEKLRRLGAPRLVQAGAVALGITCVFLMFLCVVGMIVVAVVAH